MADKAIEVQHSWKTEQWDWPLQHNDGVVRVTNTSDKFEVALDAQYFTPKEIEVNYKYIYIFFKKHYFYFPSCKINIDRK